MRPVFKRLLPLLVLPLAFAACDDSSFDPIGADAGTMSIMLTDAPGDFAHAFVTIDRIELLGGDDNDNDRIVLHDTPVTVDLLELQNQVMTLVGETPVPGGRYSELRLIISDGLIVIEQEEGEPFVAYASSDEFAADIADELNVEFASVGTLQMPSFGQSGLKIKLPSDEAIVDGDENAVLIDFNVAQSFGHQAGNSGKWVLHPVIHASGFTSTGALRLDVVLGNGVTLPTIGETQVTMGMLNAVLNRNGDLIPVLLTDANADGTWEATFSFLPPGDWTVNLGLPDGLVVTTDPALPLTFSVLSGQTVTRSLTITSAALAN